jgi:hypothetical protein
MADTFYNSYIADPSFRKWYYTSSGIPGCVPDNNPIEAHNKLMKGAPDFLGYCVVNSVFQTAVTKEIPDLIYQASEARREPAMELPVRDVQTAFKSTNFTEYFQLFDWNIDIKSYKCDGEIRYVANGIHHLDQQIIDTDIERMRSAENGTLMVSVDRRGDLVEATQRLHHLRWVRTRRKEEEHVACDCYEFYLRRWCFPSAALMHKAKLTSMTQQIPTTNRARRKPSKAVLERRALQMADVRKRDRKEREAAERLHVESTHTHTHPSSYDHSKTGYAVLTQE